MIVFVLVCFSIDEINSKDEEHGGDLMKGKGSFELSDDLIVLRGWWIDSCQSNGQEMEITLNDDYFNDTSNNGTIIDGIVTLPLYDHYLVDSECTYIGGIIINYEHDIDNEEFILTIDTDIGIIDYFKSADFRITQLKTIPLTDFEDDPNYGVIIINNLSFLFLSFLFVWRV